MFRNFRPGHDFANGTRQLSQEQEFFSGEIKCDAGTNRPVPPRVDLQIRHAQLLRVPLRGTAKQRAHPREQFRKSERLHEIIVRAQLESFYSILHAVARSEEENRHVNAAVSQFLDDGPAVFLRQHHVNNEKIGVRRQSEFHSGFTIACPLNGKAGFAQTFGEKCRRFLFVFDEQHAHSAKV